jgi:hypothetical protein
MRPKAGMPDVAVEPSRRTRTSQKRNVIELKGGAKKGVCMHGARCTVASSEKVNIFEDKSDDIKKECQRDAL